MSDLVEVEVGLDGPLGAPPAPPEALDGLLPPVPRTPQYLDTSWDWNVREMSWQELLFTSEGITLITIASVVLLFLWRTLGPREVDDAELERRAAWRDHYARFGHPKEKRWKALGEAGEANAAGNVAEPVPNAQGRGAAMSRRIAEIRDEDVVGPPNLPDTPPSVRYTRLSVGTSPGPTSVSVSGPRDSDLVIVTYHDIGSNFQTCFGELLDLPFARPGTDGAAVIQAARVYHVGVPGHQEGDDWCYGIRLSVAKLALALQEVVERFEIKRFIGVGSGAGANVLLRYSLAHPERVRGLVLNQLCTGGAPFGEASFYTATQTALAATGASPVGASNLAGLLLLPSAPADLRRRVMASLSRMNEANMRAYIVAYRDRDVVPRIRLEVLNQRQLPVLLFTGTPQSAVALNAAARYFNLCAKEAKSLMAAVPHVQVVQIPLRSRLLSDLSVMHEVRSAIDAFVREL